MQRLVEQDGVMEDGGDGRMEGDVWMEIFRTDGGSRSANTLKTLEILLRTLRSV